MDEGAQGPHHPRGGGPRLGRTDGEAPGKAVVTSWWEGVFAGWRVEAAGRTRAWFGHTHGDSLGKASRWAARWNEGGAARIRAERNAEGPSPA